MDTEELRTLIAQVDATEHERLRMRQPQAWLELQDQMHARKKAAKALPFWKWASVMSTVTALMVVGWIMGSQWFLEVKPRIEFTQINQPTVYASKFYSSEANADVIWLTGLPVAPLQPSSP